MSYSNAKLVSIFNSTNGQCHICGNALVLSNYGTENLPGSWEVDHDYPESKGGSSSLPNLKPACPPCNRSKSDKVW